MNNKLLRLIRTKLQDTKKTDAELQIMWKMCRAIDEERNGTAEGILRTVRMDILLNIIEEINEV